MATQGDQASRPTAKMIRLYHCYSDWLGEPLDLWVYEAGKSEPLPDQPPTNRPTLKNVMVWPADDDAPVTTFQSLGMSERLIPGADYFAELHMGVRAYLQKSQRERIARFLANVAEYAFEHQRTLDWWHVISNPGEIPHFIGCRHLVLHPKFVQQGLDSIQDEDGLVKVFHVVPITSFERHLLVDHGRDAFTDHLDEREIDLFVDRTDPSGILELVPGGS